MKAWHSAVNVSCRNAEKMLKSRFPKATKDDVEKVSKKIRGNLGEMMAYKIISDHPEKFSIVPGSYQSLRHDHENESSIDGIAVSSEDGCRIGVQVKNYRTIHLVDLITFKKSASVTMKWITEPKLNPEVSIEKFIAIPRQIIFSFTQVKDLKYIDEWSKIVKFIGPNEINDIMNTFI